MQGRAMRVYSVAVWLCGVGCASAHAELAPHPKPPAALTELATRLTLEPASTAAAAGEYAQQAQGAERVHALLLKANAELVASQAEAAFASVQAAVNLARADPDPELLLLSLDAQAWILLERVEFERATVSLDEYQHLAQGRALPYWMARERYWRAVQKRREGDSEASLRLHEESLAIRERIGDRQGMVDSHNALGVLRRRAGELYQALDHHTRALALARELNLRVEIASSLALVGRIYAALEDNEPAFDFMQQALAAMPAEESRERVDLLLDIASAYLRIDDLAQARRHTDDAIALALRTGGEEAAAAGYLRRATLLSREGRAQEALQWVERSLSIGRSFDGARSVLIKRLARLRILYQLERWTEATPEAAALLDIARDTGDRLVERDVLELQARVLYSAGDPNGAFLAMQAYSELNQSLATTLASRRIADMEASMKRRALESDLALTERDRDLNALRARSRQLWAVGASLGLVVLGFALLALRSRIRAVRRLNGVLAEQAERLRVAATTDALTGLINRHGALPLLDALEHTPRQAAAVMVIDLDHFKQVNDSYGHAVGDAVLRAAAQRIKAAVPAGFVLARWGGEEFLAFGHVDDVAQARQIADRLRLAAREVRVDSAKGPVGVTISIGLSVRAQDTGYSWDQHVQAADTALYRAKGAGRDRVEHADQPSA